MTDRNKTFAEMAAECATDAARATDHDEVMEWIGLSIASSLLAIHQTLTADRYAANEERQREAARTPVDMHRAEVGWRPRCATCDGGGCPDCTDPA